MRRSAAVLTALLLASLVVTPAKATHKTVHLPGDATLRILGGADHDETGTVIAPAGDFDNDGDRDLIVGTSDNVGVDNFNRAYIVDATATGDLDLADPIGAIEIVSDDPGDFLGRAATGLGDINGDGFDDIALGASFADPAGLTNAGITYVVLGSADTTDHTISELGPRAIPIPGVQEQSYTGGALAAADVDGDGLQDLLIGASGFGGSDRTGPGPGRVYVVFGKALTGPVDLASLRDDGFQVDGAEDLSLFGWSLAAAGDMNADGREEFVVGAPAGVIQNVVPQAVVIYGKADGAPLSAGALGQAGFVISGKPGNDATGDFGDKAGYSVAGGEDLNSDGIPDVVVGAPFHSPSPNRYAAGAAFVVYGSAQGTDASLEALGDAGAALVGKTIFDRAGSSVAVGPGPVTLVGAPGYSDIKIEAGAVDYVFGPVVGSTRLDRIGGRGFRIVGNQLNAHVGYSALLLDVNGDQIVATGAPGARGSTGRDGAVYVVSPPELPYNEPPPPATLTSGDTRQKAKLGNYCWDGRCVDRIPGFPKGRRAAAGQPARIRVEIDAKPDGFGITEYREVDELGRPAGRARTIDLRLKPVKKEGRIVAYDALFDLPSHLKHSFLVAAGTWSGMDRGDASWFIHLVLSPQSPRN